MFDRRVKEFLTNVILSSANPISKVKDYFYRVEFQQRGAPNIQCLFWVENAPGLDTDSDDEVLEFVDKYIKCKMPTDDDELKDNVEAVQMHRKGHSKSCKKGKKECRFSFPKPPARSSFISRPQTDIDMDNSSEEQTSKSKAKEKLK